MEPPREGGREGGKGGEEEEEEEGDSQKTSVLYETSARTETVRQQERQTVVFGRERSRLMLLDLLAEKNAVF